MKPRLLATTCLAFLLAFSALAQQTKPAPKKAQAQKDPAEVALAAAQAAVERKDYSTAVTILENFLFEHPGQPEALFQLAYCYSLQGRTAEAMDLYRETLAAYPKLVPARLNLGLLLLDSGQPEAAAAEFNRVLEVEPDHARAHWLLATALERSRKKDEATAHYRRAAELDPALGAPRRAALDRLLEEKKWAEAQALVEELLEREPQDVSLLRLRADLLLRQGKNAEAQAAYETYLEKKPDDAAAHLELGRLCREQGKTEDALRHFQAAARGEEAVATPARRELGDLLLGAQRWPEAVAFYRQAVTAAPADAELHAGLGYALLMSKNYRDAAAELAEALRLDPKRVETYNHLASALTLSGDLAGAIRALDARAAYAGETPGTLFLRARNYDELRQCRPAIEYYEKFLGVNQDTGSDQYFQATGRLRLLKNVCREKPR